MKLVRENIEFKRGKPPRESLGIGIKELYLKDPEKYLNRDLHEFLKSQGDLVSQEHSENYLDPNYKFFKFNKLGSKYEKNNEFYIDLTFSYPIPMNYEEKLNLRNKFSKFLRKGGYRISSWSYSTVEALDSVRFDVHIEPKDNIRD